MLEKFKEKIEKSHYEDRLSYDCVFLDKPNQLNKMFDCVYAQLTAHHVEDLNNLFNILVYTQYINSLIISLYLSHLI